MSALKAEKLTPCVECGSTNFVEDPEVGELTCHNCGLVVSDRSVSEGPEWRAYTRDEQDSRRRVGPPTSFSIHDKGLSTVISDMDRDAYGHQLPLATRLEMLRLKKWQIRTRISSPADRNLVQAMSELDRLTDILHIPESVKEKAAIIYRGALARGLVKGRSIAAITAASVYASCRASETPRTLKDVASACRINLILKPQKPQKDGKPPKPPKRSAVPSKIRRKDVARCYRLLVKELNLRMPIEDPIKCIAKIAAKAKITMPSQQRAMQIVNEAKKNGNAVGKDPMGLAAAALYVACILQGEAEKTQADIARAANVTEVTVRNRCKGLKEVLQLNLNNKEATTCRPPA